MTSPPVMRLSQALYTNVSWPIPARSGRKRNHPCGSDAVAEIVRPLASAARGVRLLLPRTFAVADRAYRDSIALLDSKKTPRVEADAAACACCGGDADGARHDHDANNDGSGSPSATTACSTPHGSGTSTSQTRASCSFLSPAQGVAVIAVVESVLGFSAVFDLLDRSYTAAAANAGTAPRLHTASTAGGSPTTCEDQQSLKGGSSCCCSCCGAEGCEGRGGCRADCGDEARDVTETVSRLVGWLRVAAASTVSPGCCESSGRHDRRKDGTEEVQPGKKAGSARRTKNVVGVAPSFHVDLDLDGDDLRLAAVAAAIAAAGGRAHGARYEVTGRCERGVEWIAFDLEPTAARNQGLLGGRTSETGGGALPAVGASLEVKLICHPLVTMAPDIRWCLRLIGQAKAIAALLNANAKLSTLGGGYFLTRQVGQAIRLALAQSEVAMALGDLQLAGKCRINVAYNYIWLGEYTKAQHIIHAQVAASRAVHDEELENIASIAGRFLKRARKANRRLLLQAQRGAALGDDRSGGGGRTESGSTAIRAGRELIPQKIDVKTDEWHRVRALPMYCSSSQANPVGCGRAANRGLQEML